MDIRLRRADERRVMRGFVLSLAALMAAVMLSSVLMWWANVWLASRHARPSTGTSSSGEPVAEPAVSFGQV